MEPSNPENKINFGRASKFWERVMKLKERTDLDRIATALEALSPHEREVIELHFGLVPGERPPRWHLHQIARNLEGFGKDFGEHHRNVRRLLDSGLAKMRKALGAPERHLTRKQLAAIERLEMRAEFEDLVGRLRLALGDDIRTVRAVMRRMRTVVEATERRLPASLANEDDVVSFLASRIQPADLGGRVQPIPMLRHAGIETWLDILVTGRKRLERVSCLGTVRIARIDRELARRGLGLDRKLAPEIEKRAQARIAESIAGGRK